MDAVRNHVRRAGEVLLVGTFAALATALVQVALFEYRRVVLNRIAWHDATTTLGREAAWMVPLGYLIIFGCLSLLIALTATRFPRLGSLPATFAWFSALAVFSSLIHAEQVHQYATLLLAAGVAVHAARFAARHPDRVHRLVRRGSLVLGGFFVVVAISTRAARHFEERRAMAVLPEPPPQAPNVLLLILDTVRAASMSVYGYSRPTTPGMERLADRSVIFDRAFSTTSWTLPTHGTIFTGRYAGELSTGWRSPLDDQFPTLAEWLAERGYATGGFIGNTFYASHPTGLARGFARYEDVPVTASQVLLSATLSQTRFARGVFGSNSTPMKVLVSLAFPDFRLADPVVDRKTASNVSDRFLRWQARVGERPFFAFLNFYDAHLPYDPQEPFRTRFSGGYRSGQDLYDGAIAYIDAEIERLLAELERRHVLDRTIVVITSDHGELFGEWGHHLHANGLYPRVVHVPLIISYPARVAGGVRVTETVTLRDLPRTVTDLTGLATTPAFPGASLASLWHPDSLPERSLAIADFEGTPELHQGERQPPMVSVIGDSLQYVRWQDGREGLFAIGASADTANLIAVPEFERELERLRQEVATLPEGRGAESSRLAADPD